MPTQEKKQRHKLAVTEVPVGDLKEFPGNPRIGNVNAIADSLKENGQYRPIVVQKDTNFVLAGNHTLKAARKLKWHTIDVVYVEVDHEDAVKIILADNRTNDLATYDMEKLGEVLANIPDVSGTGWSKEDQKAILDAVQNNVTEINVSEILSGTKEDDPFGSVELSNVEEPDEIDPETQPFEKKDEEDEEDFDDVLSDLQGAFALNEDMDLRGNNYYGIPDLRPDMLLDKLPEPLDTWGGKDATPDDGKTWWLYNYGVAGFSGLPCERAILSFFTYDEKFINWWDYPAYYTAKMMNSGIKHAVVPDFSFYVYLSVANHVFNTYRAQWLGRFFQECGIKVIPRVQFCSKTSLDFCMAGIPKNPPILACSIQNYDLSEDSDKKQPSDKDRKMLAGLLHDCLDKLQPKQLLIYGGPPGHRLVKELVKPSMPTVYLMNYAGKRRGVVFDKKEGLGSKAGERKAKKKTKSDSQKMSGKSSR